MTQLRFDNPETSEAFVAALNYQDVYLPLEPSEHECGVICDARGRDILTIDVNRERSDDQVTAITAYLCMAINTCGGYRAIAAIVAAPEPSP